MTSDLAALFIRQKALLYNFITEEEIISQIDFTPSTNIVFNHTDIVSGTL
jgi:hypothetical protein